MEIEEQSGNGDSLTSCAMESVQADPSVPFADGRCLFDRLPAELLYTIICRIDDIPCKMKLDSVSKRFYEANHNPQSWIFDKELAIYYGNLIEAIDDELNEGEMAQEPDMNEALVHDNGIINEVEAEPAEGGGPLEMGPEPPEDLIWHLQLTFRASMALLDTEKGLRSLDVFLNRTQLEALTLEGIGSSPNSQVWVLKEMGKIFIKHKASLVHIDLLYLRDQHAEPVTWLLSTLFRCDLPHLHNLVMSLDIENADIIWPFVDACHGLRRLEISTGSISNVHACVSALSGKPDLSDLSINILLGGTAFNVDRLLEIFEGCPKLSRVKFGDDAVNPIELSERLPLSTRKNIRKFSGFNARYPDDREIFTRQVVHYYPNIEKVSFFDSFHAETITQAIVHYMDACRGDNPRTIYLFMPGNEGDFYIICVALILRGIQLSHSLEVEKTATITECKRDNVIVKWEHYFGWENGEL